MNTPKVLIVGAGIGGMTAGIALRMRGIETELYEAKAHQRSGTALGLASNAIKVLRALGVDLADGACGQTLERFELQSASGRLIRSLPIRALTDELGDPMVSIHRNDLMRRLQDAAADLPIHYGTEAIGFRAGDTGVIATFADGRRAHADILVGADGIRSVVRTELCGASEPTGHGYVCWLATVPFTNSAMGKGYCVHYWGNGQRFGLIDIGGGMAYWWGTKNASRPLARGGHSGKATILAAFDGWPPEVTSVIERTPAQSIVSVPAQDRPFLDRWGRGPVTLLGDAAHPMLTSLSQGAGSAIEDGYVLAKVLDRARDPVAALRRYEAARYARTRKLVKTSRRLSLLEQTDNPVVRAVRNLGLRRAPSRIVNRQFVRPMQFGLGVRP